MVRKMEVKRYLVRVQGVSQMQVNAENEDEARGYVKGVLRVRNPDFQIAQSVASEISIKPVASEISIKPVSVNSKSKDGEIVEVE